VTAPLRLDPALRFSCSQCGRCCRRWDVFVTEAERDAYLRRGAARWFRDDEADHEGTDRDVFEPVRGWSGFHRIRARADGSCGFLSPQQRCRLHEELGAAHKPLTCRMFPFEFHRTPGAIAVTVSFGCPTIVSNQGDLVPEGAPRKALEALRDQWNERHPGTAAARRLVRGRVITTASIQILSDSLLAMLDRRHDDKLDLVSNLQRIADALDDLTRQRVVQLDDASFAEYVRLTLPYAASNEAAPAGRGPGAVGRMLQYGFLYCVAAMRLRLAHRSASPWTLRLKLLQLLAHFHRLAPSPGSFDVRRLRVGRVGLDAPEVQPIAAHYLRTTIGAMGASERPIVDDLTIAMSCLNAACALAVVTGDFATALMESIDVAHTSPASAFGRLLPHFTAGTEAFRMPMR
jgi:Fe-S-cluster containining protein